MDTDGIISALDFLVRNQPSGAQESDPAIAAQPPYELWGEPAVFSWPMQVFRESLRNQPELSMFNVQFHSFAGVPSVLTYEYLTWWLVARARATSATEAVADLAAYVSGAPLGYTQYMLLDGLEVRETVDLGGGVSLVPVADVRPMLRRFVADEFKTGEVVEAYSGSYFRPMRRSCLCRRKSQPAVVLQDFGPGAFKPISTEQLDQARLCLSLLPGFAPVADQWGVVFDDSVPCSQWGRSERKLSFELPMTQLVEEIDDTDRVLQPEEFRRAKNLVESFRRMNSDDRHSLTIALDRRTRAMNRRQDIDAAIDLGIALESLFIMEDETQVTEIGFRLRLRAARFLGDTREQRDQIMKLCKRLYKIRSAAVHRGRFLAAVEGESARTLLEQGFELTRVAAERIILDGKRDWPSVLLG